MTAQTDDTETDYQTIGTDATELQRYTDISFEDGQVVIYDENNAAAWVQSSTAISLERMP